MNDIMLDILGLKKHFAVPGGFLSRQAGLIRAVDDVTLRIHCGETLGLVGESGCGKSTLARMIVRLEEPTAGSIRFEGVEVPMRKGRALREYRRKIQMIFQDPYSSLNPRKTAGGIIEEPPAHSSSGGAGGRKKKAPGAGVRRRSGRGAIDAVPA